MKLADVIEVIPKNVRFVVEEYDDQGDMTYGWFVDLGLKDRKEYLSAALHETVISIWPEISSGGQILAIGILYSPKEES